MDFSKSAFKHTYKAMYLVILSCFSKAHLCYSFIKGKKTGKLNFTQQSTQRDTVDELYASGLCFEQKERKEIP